MDRGSVRGWQSAEGQTRDAAGLWAVSEKAFERGELVVLQKSTCFTFFDIVLHCVAWCYMVSPAFYQQGLRNFLSICFMGGSVAAGPRGTRRTTASHAREGEGTHATASNFWI